MGVGIESLFTSALGLQAPWIVEKVELDTARRRIDFKVSKLKHFAGQSVAAGHAAGWRANSSVCLMSSSTGNGIEPIQSSVNLNI